MSTTQPLPLGVTHTVRAMCEDYDRRAKEIERGELPPDLVGGYMIMNAAIDAAIASCCEESIRTEIRYDIAEKKGDRTTQLYYLSPRTYKLRKQACQLAIARALRLL